MKFRIWGKKIIFTTLLTMFLLVSLFFPKGVQAQMVVTDIPGLLFDTGKWIAERSWDLLNYAWDYGGAIAYRNAINLYLGQIAEQTAEYVATGGKGQKPMFMTDPDYWSKMGDQVLGEWIDQTAQSFTGFTGMSLCDPIDPTIKFNMLVGLDVKNQGMRFQPEMRCSWSTIQKRYKELSKKKLFEFNIDLKEGSAAQYKRLTNYVEADPWLTTEGKQHILTFTNWVGERADKILKDSELLQEIVDGTKNVSDAVLADLKDAWEANLNEAKAQVEMFQNIEIIKRAGECAKHDKDDFCGDEICRSLYAVGKSEEECKSAWADYKKKAEETRAVGIRALEIGDFLVDGASDILDIFGDFKPIPPPTLEDVNKQYNPEASDVAVMFKIESELFKKQAEAIEKSKFMQSLTGEMNRLSSKVSDLTLTPSTAITKQFEESIAKGTAGPIEYTGVAVADAIGVFTNTLVNKLLKQLFEKGFNPAVSPDVVFRLTNDSPTIGESQALYADLAIAPIKRGGEISIYDEFAVCPTEKKYALSTNCLIDNLLVRALEEGLTIQGAMDKDPVPLLPPNEKVGLPGDKDSLLSWPNIKKLRRFRIFPLGLEIAAYKLSHPEFYPEMGNVEKTLQQLVNEFHDTDSNFYHLVDPNWVTKNITYKCEARGYSAVPMAGSTYRQETCLDLKDCIHEDDNGQCDTWSYCTREKNIWRIEGDTCDEQYASCQTYEKTSDNTYVSYLTDTLNFGDCDQNNAGCKWYCAHWDENLSDIGDWSCVNSEISREITSEETCNLNCAEPDGCLCTGTSGSCLVINGQSSCTYPIYNEYADSSDSVFFNNKIEECSVQDVNCHEYIRTAPGLMTNLIFNGSFEADSNNDSFPDGWDDPSWNGSESINTTYQLDGDVSYKFEHTGAHGTPALTGVWQLIEVVPGKEYTISARIKVEIAPDNATINYYFDDDGVEYIEGNQGENTITLDGSETNWQNHVQTITIPDNRFYVWIAPIMYGDGVIYFDNVKFEAGGDDSSYRYYGELNKIYLKDALTCQSDEIGCELYTPINNDPAVPGIVKEQDMCVFNCLGYETFQQIPSHFDTESTQWVNLIASTAKICSLPGCEEFTNLDTEDLEYYSYLRQCVKINDQGEAVIDSDGTTIGTPDSSLCKLYYTWVGTETGYQLKQYSLKKASQQYTGDPNSDGPMKVSLETDIEWGDCQDLGDALVNPHCRQFYDASGNIYYRLYKNTVSCTESCSLYRRNVDQTVQMADASEGESCNKQNIGCLEYKGPTAGNIFKVFLDDFEDENIGEWSSGTNVSESVNFPGHSLNVSSSTSRSVAGLVNKGKTYFVSFWIKGTSSVDVSFSSLSTISKTGLNSGEWQEVKFGPFSFNTEPNVNEELIIENSGFYVDNILLKEVRDNLYLIKDSWKTPCECDTSANHEIFSTGAQGCSFENVADYSMVGCQVYQDRDGQNRYLKSFDKLCSESVVGCEALIDTQNSSLPLAQPFNEGGYSEDDVFVAADDLVYLINDEEKECGEEKKGCQKFGLPDLNVNQEVISYTDVYLINNPDLYTDAPILCMKEELGCEEYEGPVYFRDPGDKVCEYRENVAIGVGTLKTGWFKKGTDQACYYNSDGSAYEPDHGVVYGIHSSTDLEYEDWAGLCPSGQSGCTEFIDSLAANLAGNTGLELDGNNDGLPNEYIRNAGIPPEGVSTRETGVFNDGEASYKVYVPTAGNYYGLKYNVGNDMGIKVLPQTQYEVSAYIKTGAISGSVGLTMHCHNWDHSTGNFRYGPNEDSENTWDDGVRIISTSNQDWTKVWGRFTTLADTDHCHPILLFTNTSSGTAYFDTIKFVQLDSKEASYYYINNDKIKSAQADCQYRVGMKDGCVLFNDTSQAKETLQYDSTMIYADSLVENDQLVPVVSVAEGQGDSNVVLKVRRDRTCGEWLTCVGTREVWDRNAGDWYNSCEFMARCDKLIGSGEGSGCGRYVNPDPQPLNEALYTDRDVSWSGMDYSGYSLFNLYPIELLFAKETDPNIYELTYQEGEINYGIGELDRTGNIITVKKSCKIFPEKDSPFKQHRMLSNTPQNEYYKDVNVCYEVGAVPDAILDYSDCQCAYKKVEYSGIAKYYNYEAEDTDIKIGICVSSGTSESIGIECTNSTDCGAEGYCSKKSKEVSALGVRGFCLEKDESEIGDIDSCLTWWPGPGVGDPDIYQNYPEAGYTAAANRQWYCKDSTGTGAYWSDVAGSGNNCDRNVTDCDDYGVTLLPAEFQGKIKKYEINKIEIDLMGNDDANVCGSYWDNNEILKDVNGDGIDDDEDWWACGGYDHQGNNNPCTHDVFGCSCRDGGACMNVQAQFDSDEFLTGFHFKAKDRSVGDGSSGHRNADIYLKDGCRIMVNLPAGASNIVKGAYTDRLWPNSSYYSDYDGVAACAPYGAASFNEILDNRLVVPGDGLSCNLTNAPIQNTSGLLGNLFALINSNDYKTFTENTMLYDVVGPGWDLMDNASAIYAPKVASVDINSCNEAGQCDKLSDNKLTIGTQDTGNIERSQLYPASLRFFAWANSNHMPIRNLTIDWLGNGDRPELIGPYSVLAQNHLPVCNGLEFGTSPLSGACTDKYFQFVYTYRCEDSNSIGWNSSLCPAGVSNACCFKPKVYIKDNWDWCNVNETLGVYAGNQDCRDVVSTGTAYDGVIIVRP